MKFSWQFIAVLFIGVLVPDAVVAASYKCVIDGKTTYQDRPCGDDVSTRGKAQTLSPPPPPRVVSKEESQRRDGVTRRQFEPVARSAFFATKEGRLDDYMNMLCPQSRAALSAKGAEDAWKREGQRYAEAETELLASTLINQKGVTFAIKNAPSTTPGAPGQRQVRVHFLWVDDEPCVTGIDERDD